MATLLSPSSGTSLVSIDPAIVEEIAAQKRLRHSSWLHTEPDPPQVPTAANHARAPQPGLQQKRSVRRHDRERGNSLRHVKNSTEMLRQRSVKGQQRDHSMDGPTTLREGRQFTVGNVGVNGKIYLRPVIHPPHQMTQPPQSVLPPLTPPTSASLEQDTVEGSPEDPRQSIWSSSQISDISRKAPTQRSRHTQNDSITKRPKRQSHARSYSFSTLDEHHRTSAEQDPGTFKIVIDRSDSTRPKTAEHPVIPSTLEVPIPHYRLGTPRFSMHGTPILRSSTYTRTSVSDNLRSSAFIKGDYDRLFPTPPGMANSDVWYRGRSFMFDDKSPIIRTKSLSGVTRSSAALPSPSIRKMSFPIEPSLFEALLPLMDDPSVVRYSQKPGEIIAATPARIVAQISSESFMDYELVSDFFLTFRSYLQTETLLALLLARLHWAINRLQPDGRIIRIRTFAALRHWILNYFVDDFVVNRELRVQFCDKINAMYKEVRGRTSGGSSDLKIVLDLKRCWIGRCGLYWDGLGLTLDAYQDADLVPGGVPGSRDITKTRMSQLFAQSQPNEQDQAAQTDAAKSAIETWFEGDIETAPTRRARQDTLTTTQTLPISPISEQSIQALSCSVPVRVLKRNLPPVINFRAPHPVPLQGQGTSRAPAIGSPPPNFALTGRRHPTHAHKRSGSFTDSVRDDRAPLPSSNADGQTQPLLYTSPYAGSLIRGNVYPPSQPFVDTLAPTSPVHQVAQFNFGGDLEPTMEGLRPGNMATPAMKTIIGSIRRALSSKHSGSHSTSYAGESVQSAPSLKAKTSNLPANVIYHSDVLKEKRSGHGLRSHMRIDLLCAEVAQSYQTAVKNELYIAHNVQDVEQSIGIALGNEQEQPSPSPDWRRQSLLDVPLNTHRLPSQMTTGSQSIVIVDDTGLDLPAMSGALPHQQPERHCSETDSDTVTIIVPIAQLPEVLSAVSMQTVSKRNSGSLRDEPSESVGEDHTQERPPSLKREWSSFSHNKRVIAHERRSSSLGRDKVRSAGSGSTMLRRYASYQSGIAKHVAHNSIDANTTSESGAGSSGDVFDKPPMRMLRRRPGGDLRNIKNAHDLEPIVRPHSAGSITTNSDSVGGSMLVMAHNRTIGAPQSPPTDGNQTEASRHRLSLINTHSSLHVRPSFEAAVAGFAAIPDDDDGGLEATLLKLEGTYEKRSPDLSSPDTDAHNTVPQALLDSANEDKREHHIIPDELKAPATVPDAFVEGTAHRHLAARSISRSQPPHKQGSPRLGLAPESVAGSEDSYSSVPLLERGLSDESMKKPQPSPRSDVSIPRPLFSRNASENKAPTGSHVEAQSSHSSIELVDETESMKNLKAPAEITMPERSPTAESFLLDEDENLSDLSSEMSVDVIDHSEAPSRSFLSPPVALPGTADPGFQNPTHPLTHPPTPPTAFGHGTPVNPPVNLMAYQQRPLTPDPSPTQGHPPHMGAHMFPPPAMTGLPAPPMVTSNSGHIPFILACDSEVLAQQFTLVEKAALSEIEWRDLVDMRWKNHSSAILNWVDYLVNVDHKGIEIAVSRFNIMVKWALSEIVMTQNIIERAKVITKYIHVAAHARKAHNYATMLQLTIALSSIDCTRLTKTWELVPATERQIVKDLETLIQPVRNFHDLRVEMETANLQEGCIPFVGLYVHDLTYNAQKPAQIASTREGEPLVNFERYRTAATVVKSLLRLIDASTKYTFKPVEGIIDRCLWMAALSDDKIQALSRSLE